MRGEEDTVKIRNERRTVLRGRHDKGDVGKAGSGAFFHSSTRAPSEVGKDDALLVVEEFSLLDCVWYESAVERRTEFCGTARDWNVFNLNGFMMSEEIKKRNI